MAELNKEGLCEEAIANNFMRSITLVKKAYALMNGGRKRYGPGKQPMLQLLLRW